MIGQRRRRIFSKLPRLQASDPRLEQFYNRSLVHCLPQSVAGARVDPQPVLLHGPASTGCDLLIPVGLRRAWEILPLYDPEAVKRHILQFLALDITHHFAFVPTTGEAFGPWYPVNQEKIIFLIYYYVLLTGDTVFLHEQAGAKTVIDWVLHHALYRDHPDLPVALIDYGKGNNHLELRATTATTTICRTSMDAGTPTTRRPTSYRSSPGFRPGPARSGRGAQSPVRDLMWSPEDRWFSHLDENYSPPCALPCRCSSSWAAACSTASRWRA